VWLTGQQGLAAELGLLPWDFWKLTPGELDDLAEGARQRSKEEWYRTAWLVSYLLKPHLKKGKKVTPESLLPKGFLNRED